MPAPGLGLRRLLAGGRALAVLALVLVWTCPTAAEPWRWGAAGDSLTRRNPFTYPHLLADADHELHNVALGGSRVWDFIDEQVPRILRLGCTLVSVSIGTNDVLQPALLAHAPLVSPADYARLLDWAVATLQLSDSRRLIILGTVPPLEMYPGCRTWPGPRRRWARDTIDAYNRAVREIAHRRRCVLWELPSVPAAMFQSDAFHPDADGNQVLANSLRPLLPQGPAPSPRPWIQDDEPTTFLPQRGPGGRRMVGRASAQVAIQE